MPGDGSKSALDEAVRQAREAEPLLRSLQPDLFNGPEEAGEGPPAVRKFGRPPGARNKRTDEAARIYMAVHGDPLERGVEISAMRILDDGVLEKLASRLGCNRHDAAKWWASIFGATMPYMHSRLASLEWRPPGSPHGGEAIDMPFADNELVDITPPNTPLKNGGNAEETC